MVMGRGRDRWQFVIRRANPLAPRDMRGGPLGRKGVKGGKEERGFATESFRSESCRGAFPNLYPPNPVNE